MTAGHRVLCSSLIASLTRAAGPVVAQDQGLDPLIYSGAVRAGEISGVDAHGVVLYRLPFAFHLRSLDAHPWGLRVTVPRSLSALKIEGASGVGGFVKKLGIVALVPGIEVELPVGERVLFRPFVEAGLGKGSDGGDIEVLYGAGVRGHIVQPIERLHLTLGGAAIRKESGHDRARLRRLLDFRGRSGRSGSLGVFDRQEIGSRRRLHNRASVRRVGDSA